MTTKPRTQWQEWFAGCNPTFNMEMLNAQVPLKLKGLHWDLRKAPRCDINWGKQAQFLWEQIM